MEYSWIYFTISVFIAVLFTNEVRGRKRREDVNICGGEWVSLHRACYKFDKRKLGYDEAKAACEEEGGSLMSISSNAEKMKIARELQKQISRPEDDKLKWWLGLKFDRKTRKFHWEDGGPFSRRTTRWGPGEPHSLRGRRQYCGQMKYDRKLMDAECSDQNPFICERHEIASRPTTEKETTQTTTTVATTLLSASSTTTTTATARSKTSTSTLASDVEISKISQRPSTAKETTITVATTSLSTSTASTTTARSKTSTLASDVEISKITQRPTFQTTVQASTPTSTTIATTSATTTSMSTTTTSTTTTPEPQPTSQSTQTQTTVLETSSKQDTSSVTSTTSSSTSTARTTHIPRARVTTLSVLTSTTWEEKLSPFHGCFKLSESNLPSNRNGGADALTQRYEEGATSCPKAHASNMIWPATAAGTFADIPCKRGTGRATWRCGANPTCWRGEPNMAACASPVFKKILKQVLDNSEKEEEPTQEEKVAVTSALVEVTATQEMSVEDVMLTSKVIQSLAAPINDKKPKDEKAVTSIVKNVVKAGSNIVAENKSSTWEEMAPEDKVRSASNLLVAMETTTAAMAEVIDRPTVIQTKDENIDLELHVVDVAELEKMEEEELVYDDQGSDNTISIPLETLKSVSKGGLTKAVFMTHYKMADLLEEAPRTSEEEEGGVMRPKTKIASSILSASLGTETFLRLPKPITFVMKHVQIVPDEATRKCSFWDLRQETGFGRWSQDGCHLAATNTTHTTCKCDHLTNFAILMDVEGVQINVVHEKLLQFITMVGCVISILCLVASFVTFTCFGSLQGERNSIHKNLVACLFVAEVLFVAGIDKVQHQLGCTLIAGFLHFFFLCVFMWMLIEGVHMVVMLVQVFDAARSRMPYYYMCAYGIPMIIIGISAGFNYKGYGTDKFCWLTTEKYFIWSFAGPVALILLVNAVILTYAMIMVCRHSEYVLTSKEKNSGSFKTWLQGALSMEVLLGLTWTFGYFFISKETIVMAYIFTILNSLQGLFIFCFHCLLNKKVLKEYKRVLHISKRRPATSTQSASLMRKQSQSYEMSKST